MRFLLNGGSMAMQSTLSEFMPRRMRMLSATKRVRLFQLGSALVGCPGRRFFGGDCCIGGGVWRSRPGPRIKCGASGFCMRGIGEWGMACGMMLAVRMVVAGGPHPIPLPEGEGVGRERGAGRDSRASGNDEEDLGVSGTRGRFVR